MAISKITYFTTCLLLTLFVRSTSVNSARNVCDLQPISKIILSFASRLAKEIGSDGNYFFSPLSISAALSMLYVGAEGSTELQMTRVLKYGLVGEHCIKLKLSDEFRMLIDSLENKNDDVLTILVANGVFLHTDYQVSSDYTSRLQDFFKASVKNLDFSTEEEKSLQYINEWISENTKDMVPQLLNEPLDPMTVMVLVNAIYFKGLWEVPFPEKNTTIDSFYRNDGSRKDVPLMRVEGNNLFYYYDEDSNNHFLDLYYNGSNVSMLLVLPNNRQDFPKFDLDCKTLCLLKRELVSQHLTVILPKFKVEYKRELSKDMMNMGLNELFSERADLKAIRWQNDLHVSLMVHQSVIEVDESGSEASAVSGIGIDARRKPSDHVTLKFDHPFQFYIINKELNLVLFAGRVTDP